MERLAVASMAYLKYGHRITTASEKTKWYRTMFKLDNEGTKTAANNVLNQDLTSFIDDGIKNNIFQTTFRMINNSNNPDQVSNIVHSNQSAKHMAPRNLEASLNQVATTGKKIEATTNEQETTTNSTKAKKKKNNQDSISVKSSPSSVQV